MTLSEYPIHIEITPRVHLIRGSENCRFPEANSLLIDDETLTLVDAGTNLSHVRHTMKDLGHDMNEIDMIILTHFHVDHKNHAETIHQGSECEVLCNPLGEKGTRTFAGLVDFYGIEGHKYYADWEKFLRKRMPAIFGDYTITGYYHDQRPISCGEIELTPIFTPGHTLDHTCFGINGTEIIYLVDIDLTKFGPWYGNRVSDIVAFKRSIEKIIALEPHTGISSHLINPISEGLCDRLKSYMAALDQRDKRIVELVQQGYNTIDKLVGIPVIYPRIPRSVFLIFEEMMIKKHVEGLVKRGVLEWENGTLKVG